VSRASWPSESGTADVTRTPAQAAPRLDDPEEPSAALRGEALVRDQAANDSLGGRLIDFSEGSGRTYLMAPTPGKALLTNAMAAPPRPKYALRFSRETERRLRRCRASMRAAIRERLESIALEAGKPTRRLKRPGRTEPPLRFYVYEGYRVVYQVDEQTRRVVVLDLAQVLS